MIAVERNKIELDYCVQKHGLWFDESEIELLSEEIGFSQRAMQELLSNAVQVAETEEAKRCCPRCRKVMQKFCLVGKEESIIIDKCTAGHGIWFDAGELGKLLSQLSSEAGNENKIINFLGEVINVKILRA